MTLEELNTHLQNDYDATVEHDFMFAKGLKRSLGQPIHKFFIVNSEKWTCYKYIIRFFESMDEDHYNNDYKELFSHIKIKTYILFQIYYWLEKSSVDYLDTQELAKGIHIWLIEEQIA